ncbi:MAG: FkbM family methyltransferase, partial [Pseudonocardiaceae bacterium]
MPDYGLITTACTIVARNYLPAARVLASSYLEHHPDHRVVIEVIDGAPDGSPVSGADVLGPEVLAIDEQTYLRMATSYSVMELATAVKPFLLRELRRSSDVVVYLDPDIEVFAPLADVVDLAAEHSIVLTPHNLDPIPRDGKEPDEAVIMGTGLFNLGFIAVGAGSEPFLDFWADRLQQDAIVAPDQQRFTDQRWVDFVPTLFTHHVLRDPGMNIAYWNAWERPLHHGADGSPWTGDTPVKFMHFSGYRPDRPWLLSSHCARQPRVLLSEYPVLRKLCDSYGRKLLDAGYPARGEGYQFASTPEGAPLTPSMRRTFRNAWVDAERKGTEPPPHPFGHDGGARFLAWLATPANPRQAAGGLNRVVLEVWARRVDLQQAFPDPTGKHAADFRAWC